MGHHKLYVLDPSVNRKDDHHRTERVSVHVVARLQRHLSKTLRNWQFFTHTHLNHPPPPPLPAPSFPFFISFVRILRAVFTRGYSGPKQSPFCHYTTREGEDGGGARLCAMRTNSTTNVEYILKRQ